ncbi:MAG TPA: carboxypeptidase-like regulatory domain-containing protein [Clostridiales bacterium]|nr:carboxypeptidase-like regulatory domain-containing protein [Clostridiales bacterium]HQP69760.1 carboxypeptidase-like regulatory domain-containing protein [Clostridiales bacterium]
MKRSVYLLMLVLTAVFYFGCSDDDSPSKPKPTYLTVHVYGKTPTDTTAIFNSNVVVYNAETNQSVARELTDLNGECTFEIASGNYYLEVTAQEYDPSPAPNVTPVPFFVTAHINNVQNRYLNENVIPNSGYIEGTVSPVVNNVLVIAENTLNSDKKYGGVTGPDGYFVIYNVPFGSYDLDIFKAGYKISGTASAAISNSTPHVNVPITITGYSGSSLSGNISFLATTDTSNVDVVLRDPATKQVIPGMRTREDGGNYSLDSIPDGEFLAWASFENDGYVIDPDWIFKNPGSLDLSFPADSGTVLNFSVTGSIKLLSPTNPADSIYAYMADSSTPTFSWEAYPSTKEYFIEVRDINGNRIWGGFNSDGTVNHGYIDDSVTSVQFDFDGTASAQLVPGEIYQWKLWADKGTAVDSGVEQMISSSEDLLGIFQVPEPVPVK